MPHVLATLACHQRLAEHAPELERLLTCGEDALPLLGVEKIRCETMWIAMRDGVRLATDIYSSPQTRQPTIVMRTPYGRADDKVVGILTAFARRGYVVISQDCRGTGESEPQVWDYYMYESEDGYDFIEWVTLQPRYNGFIGSCGGSYVGQTQWCMARHPAMSTIVPEVSGLGVAANAARLHMFLNAYARAVGKGDEKGAIDLGELERDMLAQALATGYFNEPLERALPAAVLERFPVLRDLPIVRARRRLWAEYCALSCAERAAFVKRLLGVDCVSIADVEALSAVFGQRIAHDAYSLPHADPAELCRSLRALPLIITGWYDWALNDALATWILLRRAGRRPHLIVTPGAHNVPGYREREHAELRRASSGKQSFAAVEMVCGCTRGGYRGMACRHLLPHGRERVACRFGVAASRGRHARLVLGLRWHAEYPSTPGHDDRLLHLRPAESDAHGWRQHRFLRLSSRQCRRERVQRRSDVLTYTTAPLERDLDVVGPLRLILHASSSALDTDFSARLSDVFPDGRAIQLQSGMLRARYCDRDGAPGLLEPGRIYCFEIDMWATANRFKAGHRLRLDISSADFPRFDRNNNCSGPGEPVPALQTVYHGAEYQSHLIL